MNYDAVVITPTTGKDTLKRAITSVKYQTGVKVRHLIVVDGSKFRDRIDPDLKDLNFNMDIIQLVTNTGGEGFYGHRIYAGFAHLVNEPYVLFLDEDNSYRPDHVESCVKLAQETPFSFSLRNIYDKNDEFLCRDDCESLGLWPVWNGTHYHIDTSAYCFRRDFLMQVSPWWHNGYGGDRIFLSHCRNNGIPFKCTGKYSLNYFLDGNPNSASPDFFRLGNQKQKHRAYRDKEFPWSKE